MSEKRTKYRIAQVTQFVRERAQWAVYLGADNAAFVLDTTELEICLTAVAGVNPRDSESSRRLIDGGVLVADEADSAPFDRASWVTRGWSAAYDFAVSLYSSSEPVAPPLAIEGSAPFGDPRGIIEHYPPAPTAPPLSHETLQTCLDDAILRDVPQPIEVAVAAISVDGMAPGWYRTDGNAWPNAAPLPAAAEFEELAPVAFGRADFAVQALTVVTAMDPHLETLDSHAYARLLITGGSVLSRLEGAASDAGLSARGNYAVHHSVADRLGLTPEKLLLIGAIAIGAR